MLARRVKSFIGEIRSPVAGKSFHLCDAFVLDLANGFTREAEVIGDLLKRA